MMQNQFKLNKELKNFRNKKLIQQIYYRFHCLNEIRCGVYFCPNKKANITSKISKSLNLNKNLMKIEWNSILIKYSHIIQSFFWFLWAKNVLMLIPFRKYKYRKECFCSNSWKNRLKKNTPNEKQNAERFLKWSKIERLHWRKSTCWNWIECCVFYVCFFVSVFFLLFFHQENVLSRANVFQSHQESFIEMFIWIFSLWRVHRF